jgi:hypothetical protein
MMFFYDVKVMGWTCITNATTTGMDVGTRVWGNCMNNDNPLNLLRYGSSLKLLSIRIIL